MARAVGGPLNHGAAWFLISKSDKSLLSPYRVKPEQLTVRPATGDCKSGKRSASFNRKELPGGGGGGGGAAVKVNNSGNSDS